jgi:anaerobic magnesium-protoporphyrin IX monomethyl ester cyclase
MAECDILLVVPPFSFASLNSASGRAARRGGYYLYYPPLGLCGIGAALRADGFTVCVVDGQFERDGTAGVAEIATRLRPKVIGVGVTTPALGAVAEVICRVRVAGEAAGNPHHIVVGGPHISCDPEMTADIGADFGVVGDGEEPLRRLCAALLRGEGSVDDIPGIVVPRENGVKANPPEISAADNLPEPDRSLVPRDAYFNPFMPARTTIALSARGCPHRCAFCCRSGAMGAYRPRAVDAVLDELARIDTQGYGFVSIIDETFLHDAERAAAIAEGMLRTGIRFRWSCQTRADTADAETLQLLARAGCINISFGVETGSQARREAVGKPVDDDAFRRAFSNARRAGLTSNAFVMLGHPGETREDIRRSIEFVVELDPDYATFNLATLFPGTEEFAERQARGQSDRELWLRVMRGEPMPLLSDTLDRAELALLLRKAHARFYLRPGYVARQAIASGGGRRLWHMARRAGTVVADYVLP